MQNEIAEQVTGAPPCQDAYRPGEEGEPVKRTRRSPLYHDLVTGPRTLDEGHVGGCG